MVNPAQVDAVILVGGMGTRLRPLTLSAPKPMLPTAGLAFLTHLLSRIADAGIDVRTAVRKRESLYSDLGLADASDDQLLDAMAARAAAAQRMLNSMSPEQRQQLMELSAQAFGSPALMESLARLDGNLQALRPGEDWFGSEQMGGQEGLGLGDGTGVFQDLAELDALSEQLSQSYGGARMDDLDLDALSRQLGEQAAVDARTLQRLEQALRWAKK